MIFLLFIPFFPLKVHFESQRACSFWITITARRGCPVQSKLGTKGGMCCGFLTSVCILVLSHLFPLSLDSLQSKCLLKMGLRKVPALWTLSGESSNFHSKPFLELLVFSCRITLQLMQKYLLCVVDYWLYNLAWILKWNTLWHCFQQSVLSDIIF